MRARFRALSVERNAIIEQSHPLRERRDAIEAKAREEVAKFNEQIEALEAPVRVIKSEMARLARALNGKT